MSTRDDLFKHFGPVLLEALALVIKDEINLLRAQHGLEERTNQQIIDAVDAKLAGLSTYDWMARKKSGD